MKPRPKSKGFSVSKKNGMIFLSVLILGSTLTAFMSKPAGSLIVKLIIKFSDYEYYSHDVSVESNTTLLQALSNYYYVRLINESLYCVRDYCNDNVTYWLAFTDKGIPVSPETKIVNAGETYYLIYNKTSTGSDDKDLQAIKDLLKI